MVRLALALSLALAAPAMADLYPAPSRPLARNERLAIMIRETEAIVVGRLVSSYDTTVTRRPGPRAEPMRFGKARLEPERWLKGSGGKDPLVFCSLDDDDGLARDAPTGVRGPERSEHGRRVVVFMSGPAKKPAAVAETALGALQRGCAWVAGVVSVPHDDIPAVSFADSAFVSEIARGLSRQSSIALARGADAIVLAHVPAGGATGGGTHVDIEVRRALVGTVAAGKRLRVELVAPVAAQFRGQTGLWFLRRDRGGGYTPLELTGGVLEVVAGRVPNWSMSLEEAERRIARARERKFRI